MDTRLCCKGGTHGTSAGRHSPVRSHPWGCPHRMTSGDVSCSSACSWVSVTPGVGSGDTGSGWSQRGGTPNIPILSPMCGFSAVVCCHLLGTSSTSEPQLAGLELGLCRDQPWGHHPPQKLSPALAKKPDGSQACSQHPPTSFYFPSHRCYNCGGLDHHAKECKLPPQPKKCHFCQSISHMVANCPVKAQQSPSSQGKPAYFREEEDMHGSALLPETRE